MSQVTIEIGGRSFEVVCQEGEEQFLHSAAAMLDEEAQKLDGGGGRVTESRMLLMSGLLLADRTAATEEKLAQVATSASPETLDRARDAEAKLRVAEVDMATIQAQLAQAQNDLTNAEEASDALVDRLRSERDHAIGAVRQVVDQVKEIANA
jgi:cell division protein ZapA